MRNNRSGFTLVELIVVIIIVGILASISVPLMQRNVKRAQKTEAVAVLGSLRTAERLVKMESTTGSYELFSGGNLGTEMSKYISQEDINGKYYTSDKYSCDGTSLVADDKDDLSDSVTMDLATGNLTNY